MSFGGVLWGLFLLHVILYVLATLLSVYPVSHMAALFNLWRNCQTFSCSDCTISHPLTKLQCVQGLIFPCPCQHLPLYVSVGSPPRGVRWRLIMCLSDNVSSFIYIGSLCSACVLSFPPRTQTGALALGAQS